jgi:peptidoglycan-associated lipoprotein
LNAKNMPDKTLSSMPRTMPTSMRPGRALTSRVAAQAAAVLAALALVGCASNVPLDPKPPVESRTPSAPAGTGTPPAGGAGTGTGGAGAAAPQSQVTTVDLARTTAEEANRAGRVILFDFDSFVVKDEFRNVVDAHGKALVANRQRRVAIEGHTDERGGREYNLALGQRRAEAVGRALVLLGAQDNQIEAVSFGKERPAAQGSNEAAWAQNRRAEINVR